MISTIWDTNLLKTKSKFVGYRGKKYIQKSDDHQTFCLISQKKFVELSFSDLYT